MAEVMAKPTLRERGVNEFKEFLIIGAYLFLTFGAVLLMKAAVLHDQGISFAPLSAAAIKAAILAKFILIGEAMRLGEGFKSRPLIWPTLYKSVSFLVFLIILTIVEEIVVGLFHDRSAAASLQELFGAKLVETLAAIVIVQLVLIPYFGFRELSETLGRGKIARLFFSDRGVATPS